MNGRRISFGGDPFGEGLAARPLAGPVSVFEFEGGAPLPPVEGAYPPRPGTPSQIIEPVDGWWRQQGAFGFGFNGLPPAEGDVIPLTEQLRLPGPPRQWWIHWYRFNRDVITEASAFGNWELRGRITYGVGGIQNIVECDLMQGLQLAVVASSIKIDLVTYNPVPSQPYSAEDDPANYVVCGGMFGDGAGAGALPATYTTPAFQAQAVVGLTEDIAVPDFARSLCLHTSVFDPATLNDVFISFITPAVAQKVVRVSDVYAQLTQEKGIAIPAGTNQIRLAVAAAHATEYFSLQFFLAL